MVWNYSETSISWAFWEYDLLANGAFCLTEKWLKHFSELPKQHPIELENSVRWEKTVLPEKVGRRKKKRRGRRKVEKEKGGAEE